MIDTGRDRDAEARMLHDEELAEDALMITGQAQEDDPDLEGYDEEQRAEVLEAEQTDPYARDIISNLQPDEEEGALPDDDPLNDPAEDDME